MSGCATPPKPLSIELSSQIKRVAVVSTVGDTFTRKYTGITVFGNEMEGKDISDWGIDQKYEEQIGAEITKGRSISVVKSVSSKSEFAHLNDSKGFWSGSAGPNWDAVETAVKARCSAESLDALFVLAKSTTPDFLAGTNQSFGGAGIYVRRTPIGSNTSVMHLISNLALLDCRTGKVLEVRVVATNQTGAIFRSVPLLPLPMDVARMPIADWTDEVRETLRIDLVNLPTQAWTVTINSMIAPGQ